MEHPPNTQVKKQPIWYRCPKHFTLTLSGICQSCSRELLEGIELPPSIRGERFEDVNGKPVTYSKAEGSRP